MNYVDFAIASSIFLLFFGAIVIFTTNYFSNIQGLTKESEFREIASNFFKQIFGKKGVPEDWYTQSENPVQAGLIGDLYQVPIVVEEDGYNRTNELISINFTFDKKCENKIRNSSVRVFNENYDEIDFQMVDKVFCSNSFLQSGNLVWEDNISANYDKKYFIYYSPDNITNPNYTTNFITAGYWNFDEGSGNIAHDSTANNNDGTINGATWVSSGKYNYGLNFSGLDENANYVNIPDSPSLYITQQITIEAWVYLTKNLNLSTIVNKGVIDTSDAYELNLNSDPSYRYISFVLRIGGSRIVCNSDYGLIDNNTWTHVAATFDGDLMKIYKNGILNKTCDPVNGNIDTNNDPLTIGAELESQPIHGFGGKIDEVRIYNRALTAEEVNISYYSSPIAVKIFPEKKLEGLSTDRLIAIRNRNIDEIRKTLGEIYKFKIEVFEP